MFNLTMEHWKSNYSPSLDMEKTEKALGEILVSGRVADGDLERRVHRLSKRFRIYARRYHYGLWAQGLSVSGEMRSLTEVYLPMEEIVRAFDRLFSLSLRFTPFRPASILHGSECWLSFLQKLRPKTEWSDPAKLLQDLMADEGERRRFIFSNFMPARYGGGFGRYSGQYKFLAAWLEANKLRLDEGVRCLDAACGAGEGTYELAQLLFKKGFSTDSILVRGVTVEPLELFAAAHAYFPHDPIKEINYRNNIKELLEFGVFERIHFRLEMLGYGPVHKGEKFDVILCNGFLGGPFMHDMEKLERSLIDLSGRLARGGILLAANRFHGGWRHHVSEETIRRMLERCGLALLPVADGVGGVKT